MWYFTPLQRRNALNASEYHFDPFDPSEDRWPGDRFMKYTWVYYPGQGMCWIAVGATDDAIDDSGGV